MLRDYYKERLETLVKTIEEAVLTNQSYSENILQDIADILVPHLGELNTNLILRFSLQYQNDFDNIDELCDYLLDPYNNLVSNNSAYTVDQLVQLFPDETMFKVFQETIKQHNLS